MLTSSYAQALQGALKEGMSVEDALKGLDRTLARHGHEKLKADILEELVRLMETERKSATNKLLVARDGDVATMSAQVKTRGDAPLDIAVDPTLIGGYVLQQSDTRIDKSYKRALLDLYGNIISRKHV